METDGRFRQLHRWLLLATGAVASAGRGGGPDVSAADFFSRGLAVEVAREPFFLLGDGPQSGRGDCGGLVAGRFAPRASAGADVALQPAPGGEGDCAGSIHAG